MMCFLRELVAIFWDPKFWLPGLTWEDIKSDEHVTYADYKDLLVVFPATVILLLLRHFAERYVFSAFGAYLGIKKLKPKKVVPNPTLEIVYRMKGKSRPGENAALSRKVGWSEREVERWFRRRRAADRPTTLKKFTESCWKCLCHTYLFLYGALCLWNKPWLWDITFCLRGQPFHAVTWDCWMYYVQSLTFYTSFLVTHFFDVKRKDFWQMFIHHILTVGLMWLSWICHLHRIGTIVLLLHDSADIFVDAAKMAKYANYSRLSNVLFLLLTVTWMVTRMGIFPIWIIYSALFDSAKYLQIFPGYRLFCAALVVLMVLHTMWTYLILKLLYHMCRKGEIQDDLRSCSDPSLSDDDYSSKVQILREPGAVVLQPHKTRERRDKKLILLSVAALVLLVYFQNIINV